MGCSSTWSTPGFYATASCGCQVQSLRRDGVKVFIISSGTRDEISFEYVQTANQPGVLISKIHST